jgi:protein-tyrosine phosphatase
MFPARDSLGTLSVTRLAALHAKESYVSATGLIDLHSHLLPGVDDGCRTIEESVACIEVLIAQGFTGSVCTPHMAISAFPENTPANVAPQVAALRTQLRAAGLEYELWAGGELRINENTISWLRQHGVPTLGPSRHVLIDYWGSRWPRYADLVIEYLLEEDYHPILAHPERMDLEQQAWDVLLGRLKESGVWLQGNLRCLAGGEGPRVAQRARRLLSEDRYRALATDMHGTPDLPDRLAGVGTVEQQVGTAKLRELLSDSPYKILSPTVATPGEP